MAGWQDVKQVDQIGFPEFTAKIVKDTFAALIDANVTQMEAYTEMVKVVGATLSEYINNTKDYVSADQIIGFLAQNMPPTQADEDANQTSSIYKGKTLSATDARELNDATTFTAESGETRDEYNEGETLDDNAWDSLLEILAKVIAQNKYIILKEMVKQGMLRLVVNDGTIETRLNFYANSTIRTHKSESEYKRDTERKTHGGGFRGGFRIGPFSIGGGYSGSKVNTELKVQTSRSSENTYDSTRVHLFGGVKLNFKTDYLALTE
jgi:hypothetical protein